MNEFAKKQMWRKLQQKYGVEGEGGSMPPGDDAPAPVPGMRTSYVPPACGARPGRAWPARRWRAWRRCPNTTTATSRRCASRTSRRRRPRPICRCCSRPTEGLRASTWPRTGRRWFLAGFAFVSFVHRQDAERAMQALQGHGYDHLILKIEWAKPSAPKPDAGGGGEGGLSFGLHVGLRQGARARYQGTSEVAAPNLTATRVVAG